MESELIGLAGVVIGVVLGVGLGEYFRRNNRIEVYSQKIFDKRLTIHEELFARFITGNYVISEVMKNTALSEEERANLVSSVIIPICEFMDQNAFYINKYLIAQVATTYIGAEDVLTHENDLDITAARSKVYKSSKATKKMILEESGVTEAFKHFSTISKSKPDSEVIKRIKELERLQV